MRRECTYDNHKGYRRNAARNRTNLSRDLRAYVVQQLEFDRADIEDLICGMSDADVMACYDVGIEQFKSLIDDMAYEMRCQIDKYDVSWEYARDEAVRSVIEEAGTNVRT